MSTMIRGCPEMTSSVGWRGRGGVCQSLTVDDLGEGRGLVYLIRPDDTYNQGNLYVVEMYQSSRPKSVQGYFAQCM